MTDKTTSTPEFEEMLSPPVSRETTDPIKPAYGHITGESIGEFMQRLSDTQHTRLIGQPFVFQGSIIQLYEE